MGKALVTGGCGFLGSWIVRTLVHEGREVRVLAFPGESRDNLDGVDVEVVEGDICAVESCKLAVAGCQEVFHAAALYLDWAPDPTRLYDVNMRGTFNVLEAARREDVEKLVYTASIVSLGRPEPGQVAAEQTAYESWDIDFPYSRSKFFSRELAEYFADWGLDVRVVCPGIIMGPGDIRPTPSGQIIINSLKGAPSVYFDGGASYVDVRDVAKAHQLAADQGRAGERYIASAHNLSNKELVEAIDRAIGRRRHLVKLPVPIARAVAVGMDLRARQTGHPPMLSRDLFEYSLKSAYCSSAKASKQLGLEFRSFDETVRDAVAYFRSRGMA